jgi:hypothetical protein
MGLVDLYREMAELTHPLCARCDPPHHCCELAGCVQAMSWTTTMYDMRLPRLPGTKLPFLSSAGCTVAPHHRSLCTTWLCRQALLLAPPRYFELQAQIAKAEKDLWIRKKSR